MFMHEELLDSYPNDFDSRPYGDVASSQSNYVWVVEKFHQGHWGPCPFHLIRGKLNSAVRAKRDDAREIAKYLRILGHNVRVVPYKACLDTRGRHNRQVKSERLDA